ncbi:MAG TPA: hypothetical protein VHW00_19520 [Thermoanaerobaculia bacterium]|nr:hypothetical protein [Thermoanaerobaculia bacterium]
MIRPLVAGAVLLFAGAAFADPMQTALTPSNVLYSIAPEGELPLLEITQRNGDVVTTLLVPGTDDAAVESHPRLVWDGDASRLFVVWHRDGEEGDEIRLATYSDEGQWSEPLTISGCATAKRAGLQVAVTHLPAEAEGEPSTSFVNVSWWKLGANGQTPEYALIAFENGQHVSTDVQNLFELAAVRGGSSEMDQDETYEALHPPMAMSRTANASDVDIVFGSPYSTALTRVKIQPKKVASNTRMWRPGRVGGGGIPKAGLASTNAAPVRSFISNGRIVLYTPDQQFRYVVYENGAWTPTRMIALDETLTGDELVDHLRRAVENQETSSEEGAQNE